MQKMSNGGRFAWALVVVLAILHYDFWLWDDRSVVLGFLPIGLLWQLLISLGAATAWLLVVKFAWPTHLEEWAGQDTEDRLADGAGDDDDAAGKANHA